MEVLLISDVLLYCGLQCCKERLTASVSHASLVHVSALD